jgi:hypothetical protein
MAAPEQPGSKSTDGVEPAAQPTNPETPAQGNTIRVKTPWTHPKLQGDDADHTGFGFPTITYANPVDLTPEQYEAAKAVARAHRFRLKEVKV